MDDTPVPTSHVGVVNGALLEAAAEAVEDASVSEDEAPAYKGVYKTRSNKFKAKNYDTGTGKSVHLGSFDMAEEAARAFDAHARSQGDKALNFPNAEAGEVKAVKGELSKTTLKRTAGGAASGGAASSARKKRAAPAAGAAAASPAKHSSMAPGAKASPRPPPLFRGPPTALPQPTHPPPPPPPPQPQQPVQQHAQQQQSTLPPAPAPPPSQQLGTGHAAPLPLPPSLVASPEEAFIASLSLADPACVLARMRAADISLPDLLHATRPCGSKEARQQAWSDLCDDIGVASGGERARIRAALARMQQ